MDELVIITVVYLIVFITVTVMGKGQGDPVIDNSGIDNPGIAQTVIDKPIVSVPPIVVPIVKRQPVDAPVPPPSIGTLAKQYFVDLLGTTRLGYTPIGEEFRDYSLDN